MGYTEFTIEGRNAVMEAFRAGKPIDKIFVLDGCQDGPVSSIKREAKKKACRVGRLSFFVLVRLRLFVVSSIMRKNRMS